MYELSGSIVPLVTPMQHDGSIDYQSLKKLLAWHDVSSTNGFVVMGSTGEGTLLSEKDREALLSFVIDHSKIPIWAGVSQLQSPQVIDAIAQAADLGADGVMLASPLYIKPQQSGLVSYFNHIADNSELNILMYNVPSRTGNHIDVETACILSHHDKIMGIKDCVITNDRMRAYKEAATNFEVYCGDDREMLNCLAAGGAGVISVIGNLLPQLVALVCSLAHSDMYDKAHAIEMRWQSVLETLNGYPNPVAIKWLMAQKGLINPFTRSPLMPLDYQSEQQLQELMQEISMLWGLNPECV